MSQGIEKARSLLVQGHLDAAKSICAKHLEVLPDRYELICLLGEISAREGNVREALEAFSRAIQLQPDQPGAYYKRANLLKDYSRLDESLGDYSRAIALNPSFARAFCNAGVVLQRLKRFQEALVSYEKAVELDPADAFAFFNRAAVLRELNRPYEALLSCQQAILAKPDFAECYCNLGLLQAELEDDQNALKSYDRCIEINAEFFAAHFNRGALLQGQKRWQEALLSYSRVIELKPDHADAYCNRGVVLMELRNSGAALTDFDQAAQLKADFWEAYSNRGILLAQMRRHNEALEYFDKAIALKPDCTDALYNRADIFLQAGRFDAAVDSYDAAFRIEPNRSFLRGMRLYAQMNLCDWTNFDAEIQRIIDGMEEDASVSPPFPLLTFVDRPELHLKCAESWVRHQSLIHGNSDGFPKRQRRKIRIGYFSGDFRVHPVSSLMVGVIENHDQSRFESVAFSYGPNVQDDMRRRLEGAFDSFLDVSDASDQDIAMMARRMNIDIAVDLAGYTGNGRSGIFGSRAAPIQVGYIGYLGTTGAPYMDYLVADPVLIPPDEQRYYSERIIYLPSYQANDSKRRISDTVYIRERLGLPRDAFVFACFNANFKITPMIFSVWMRILTRVRGSVLFLYAGNQMAERNLRVQAERRGIDPSRIVFGERLALEEYLARYRVMDLFLDTLPYNAGTTASDALWAGLPVLTCVGRAFAGRIAASLLTALNLPELITFTAADYEELAVSLALNPSMMAKIREKLALNSQAAPLFNTARFTRNLEAAYVEVVQRYDAGLERKHIYAADGADAFGRDLLAEHTQLEPHA